MKSVGIRRFSGPYFLVLGLNVSPYFSVFSPNAGKYGPEKLRIRALFTLVIAKMVILHLLTILLSLHMKCLFSQKMFTTRKKKHFICSFSPLHATGLSLSLSLSLSLYTHWSLSVPTDLFLYSRISFYTYFMTLVSFYTSILTIFWCFQGVEKWNSRMKWKHRPTRGVVNFANILRTYFYRTPPDDCF